MANKIPAYYAQETIRLVAQPRPELEALLDQHELPRALLGSARVEGDMDAESYGRLFMSLLRLLQKDLHTDPELVLDLSSYRLLYGYMLQSDKLGDAITRAATYYRRFHPEQRSFTLERRGDQAVWRFQLEPVDQQRDQKAGFQHFSMGTLSWLPGLTGRMIALYTWHRLAS